MKENRVKRILREGGLALGTHVGGIADPLIVEPRLASSSPST
jgi:hypothetical protein